MGMKMWGTWLGWRVVPGPKPNGVGQPVGPFSEEALGQARAEWPEAAFRVASPDAERRPGLVGTLLPTSLVTRCSAPNKEEEAA